MRSSWRRSTALVLALAVAMLLGLAGMASAAIIAVEITDPNGSKAYVHSGDTVTITAAVSADAGNEIYMRAGVGTGATGSYESVGTATGGTDTFTAHVTLSGTEPEGWKNVSVDVYTGAGPTYSYMSDTNLNAVCVDNTAPVIEPKDQWNPALDCDLPNATSMSIVVDVAEALSGSGIDPATVLATVTGTGSASASLTGDNEVTISLTGLSLGANTVTLNLSDRAGNAAVPVSGTVTVTDTLPPVIDDTSWSIAEGSWINTNAPTLTVAVSDAEPSSGIGAVSATVTAPGSASATYDPVTALVTIVLSGLPEGDNAVTLNVSDVAGNGPTTETLNFKVDTTKPLIEPSASWDPAMPHTLADATVLSVDVDVTEAGSGIDPATVVATVDTGGSATTSVAGSVVTISLTGLKYDANVVTLNLSDNVGNAALPVDGTVNVTDTVAPAIDDTSWSIAEGSWINTNAPTLTVAVSDAEPSSGIGAVSATVTAPGSASATYDSATALVTIVLSGLPEGDNTVTLNVSDVAGNGPTTETLNFKVDTTKPLIEPSANWDPAMPHTLADATVLSVDVDVIEAGSGIDPATVVATVDTGGSATTSVAGSVVTISLTGLKYDANVVTLNLSDNVGNAALPVDGTVNVTDTVAPAIDDTSWSIAEGSWINTNAPTLTVAVSDAEPSSGIGAVSATVTVPGSASATYDSATGLVTIVLSGLPEGDNTVTLNVSDVAGNGPTTETLNFKVDTVPPVIDDLSWSIAEGSWIPTSFTALVVDVSDPTPGSGVDGLTASVTVTGDGTVNGTVFDELTGQLTIQLIDLGEGAHTVTVDVSDNAGNAATQASWTFKVDTVDPVINEATWAGPWTHEPGHWTINTSPTITVAAYDPGADDAPPTGSGIAAGTASAALSRNNVPITVLPGTVTFVDGKITVVLAGLADGEYELTVGIYDNVGNLATPKSVTFHVDATGPDFANSYPPNGYETNNRVLAPHIDITDAGVGVDPGSIAWTMARQSVFVDGTLTPPWDGLTSTFKADADLASDGQYTLTVSADDLLGNNSTYPSGTWSFLLDTTAPVLDGIELDLYRQIPYVDGVIYTPSKTPEVRVDFSDPAPASGFNGAVCDVAGTFYVFVYKDAAMTELVPGTLTRDATPSTSSDPWGGEWVPGDDLDDGDYFVKVVITDDAGNTRNPATYDFRFIVDTKPPDIDNSDSEVGFLNGNNNRRFANSRILEVKWDRTPDPEAESGVPGSGLLGYEFEIWTKAETDVAPIGEYLQYGYTDEDYFNGDWLDIVEPTGTETEVYTMRRPAGFESGKSYGAWLKAYDMLHNGSAWFDPPFIFDPDAPTDPGVPEVQGLKTGRRTNDSTPALKWAHSTDEKVVAQSGVDLYEVQITAAGTTTWDIHYEIDIPDEDVDKIDEDHALDPSGDPFEWTVPSKLEDGGYEVRVRAKDVAGNYSNWVKIAAPFTIDTQAPPVPGIPVPKATPTNIRKPEWTWASSAGAVSYNVYMDDKDPINVTTAVFTSGDYTDDLDEGTHHLRVTALDDLGNESATSGTGHVVIDLTKPVAPVMFGIPPFINGNWDNSVTLIWTAQEDAVEYEVAYKIGAASGTKKVAVQTYVLNLGTLSIPDGTEIEATVSARDAAGNWSDPSNEVLTRVDSQKPTVKQEDPIPSGRMKLTPTWTWSAQDGTGSQVSHYIVLLNGELLLETTSTSFKPASELDTGEYTLTVVAVDNVGNQSDPDVDAGRFPTVTIDKQAPAVPGMPTTTSPTNSQTPTWTWKHISDADLEKYNVYLDGSLKGSVGGPWSLGTTSITWLTPEDLGHGLHVLEVTSVDDLGNESARSTPGHVFVDLNAPAIPGAPIARENPTNKPTQRWDWSYVEGAARFEVQYQLKGAPGWTEPIDVGTDTTYETTFVGNGVIGFLRVRAFDVHGNVGNPGNPEGWSVVDEEEERGLVYVDTVAPDAPDSLHLTSVDRKVEQIDERLYTNDDRVIVWWSADEDESDTFRVVIDGHAYSATERRFHVVEALADGIHWVRVIAIDELGNESDPSEVLWFIVDTKAPEVPGMPTTESPTNNAEPTWTWLEGETKPYDDEDEITLGCGFSHYNVYLDGKLVVLDEEDQPITEPTFQCELTDGLHVLEVTSVDLLGNESERSTAGHVLIDTDVPKAPIMKVLPPFTNAATVRFEWTKSSADTDHYEISYTVDGGANWSAPLEIAGEFYVLGIADVPDGVAVSAKVRAYDKAGNKSVWSNELLGAPIASTIVDRTGPVVTLTNPTAAVTTNAAKFKYEWTAVDAGCGVASYTVEFNGSKHQVDETSEDDKYWYEPTLMEGDNTFKVFATDKLGNVGEAKVAPIVKQVKPQIILVQPMPGAEYKINEISTIAFQVIGLIDAVPEVRLNGEPIDAWRIVTVVNTPTMAKFYILLDGDVMVPGTMGIRITVGAGSELFIYTVDSERSGFGFGRLRPW